MRKGFHVEMCASKLLMGKIDIHVVLDGPGLRKKSQGPKTAMN